MTLHRHTTWIRALLVVALAVGLGACGSRSKSDTPSTQAVRSGFGPGSSSSSPGSSGGSTPPTAVNTPTPAKGVKPTAGSASLQDPPSDALKVGSAPAYADIQAAAIRGHSGTITFTLTYAAALPASMPDAQTTFKTGFRIKIANAAYVVTATAATDGWRVNATKNGTAVAFPGTLQTKGTALTLVAPWSFFGGPRTFSWTGFAAWDEEAATRSYSVDIVPNSGEAAFPQA
jgi:hypothetical protein